MTAHNKQNELVPPQEKLTPPESESPDDALWIVVALNRRVNRKWEDLILRAGQNATRCYRDLCNQPMQRQQGRVFPLRGNAYKGAWEYEVTGGDRVFYKPYSEERKVVVYYAGEHKKPAPTPP